MKITIDTRHDPPEDIRKAIELLAHLSGERPRTNFETKKWKSKTPNIFEEKGSQETPSAFANLFGSPESKLDLTKSEEMEEPDERVEVIPY